MPNLKSDYETLGVWGLWERRFVQMQSRGHDFGFMTSSQGRQRQENGVRMKTEVSNCWVHDLSLWSEYEAVFATEGNLKVDNEDRLRCEGNRKLNNEDRLWSTTQQEIRKEIFFSFGSRWLREYREGWMGGKRLFCLRGEDYFNSAKSVSHP